MEQTNSSFGKELFSKLLRLGYSFDILEGWGVLITLLVTALFVTVLIMWIHLLRRVDRIALLVFAIFRKLSLMTQNSDALMDNFDELLDRLHQLVTPTRRSEGTGSGPPPPFREDERPRPESPEGVQAGGPRPETPEGVQTRAQPKIPLFQGPEAVIPIHA